MTNETTMHRLQRDPFYRGGAWYCACGKVFPDRGPKPDDMHGHWIEVERIQRTQRAGTLI